MALLDVRLRAGYLFLAVVIGHVVLISAQVNAKTGVPILETVTFGAFAEVQRATSAVLTASRTCGPATSGCAASGRENEALQARARQRAGRNPAAARAGRPHAQPRDILELREQHRRCRRRPRRSSARRRRPISGP